MYEGLLAETIRQAGHNGDEIEAYYARPLGPGPFPGVVVVHHMPGWDEATIEITRKLAHHGYAAICPHLFHRHGGAGVAPEDAAAAARADGGISDDQFLGDAKGALDYLEAQADSSGATAMIGHCSGGRQAYIAAASLPLDAAINCYGGRVVATPQELSEKNPVAPVDMTPDITCPILCLFGADDQNPSPEHKAVIELALKEASKTFEIRSYEGAGHGFFAVDRPSYRVEAAVDGWQLVFRFLGTYLRTEA